jgi:hypothetical protein
MLMELFTSANKAVIYLQDEVALFQIFSVFGLLYTYTGIWHLASISQQQQATSTRLSPTTYISMNMSIIL